MRMLSMILSFAMLFAAVVPQGAMASSLSEKKVEEAFNRLQYAMNVEWDQQDEATLSNIQNDFEENIRGLRAQGLTIQEIQDYMMKKLLTGEALKDYLRTMDAVKGQNFSEEEATQIALDFMAKNYKDGAHFYGKGGGQHGGHYKWILCAVIVVVVVKICLSGSDKGHDDHDYGHGHGGHGRNGHESYQY